MLLFGKLAAERIAGNLRSGKIVPIRSEQSGIRAKHTPARK